MASAAHRASFFARGIAARRAVTSRMRLPAAAKGSSHMPSSRVSQARARPRPDMPSQGRPFASGPRQRSAQPQSPAKKNMHRAGKMLSR